MELVPLFCSTRKNGILKVLGPAKKRSKKTRMSKGVSYRRI